MTTAAATATADKSEAVRAAGRLAEAAAGELQRGTREVFTDDETGWLCCVELLAVPSSSRPTIDAIRAAAASLGVAALADAVRDGSAPSPSRRRSGRVKLSNGRRAVAVVFACGPDRLWELRATLGG